MSTVSESDLAPPPPKVRIRRSRRRPAVIRPWRFSGRITDVICRRVSEGESLRGICADPPFPTLEMATRWLRENRRFGEKYAAACEERVENLIEEARRMARADTTGERHWARVYYEALKWHTGKVRPRKHAGKPAAAAIGKGPDAAAVERARKRLESLRNG